MFKIFYSVESDDLDEQLNLRSLKQLPLISRSLSVLRSSVNTAEKSHM